MSSSHAVEISRLSVSFRTTPALQDVSLLAPPGDFLLLTGPSGSGKSTLLRCLNGLIPHTLPAHMTGEVEVSGLNTREHEVAHLARTVGFVFQNPETQLFNLTVGDEVLFGPRNLGLPEAEAARRAEWAIQATGLGGLEQRRLITLSGGEKQRVAIASVLGLRPSTLVLDEPMANLDVPGSRAVLETITHLCRQEGISVIIGEHRTGAVGRMAGRMLVLNEGHLLADGPTGEVFAQRELIHRLGVRRPVDEPEQPWENLIGEGASAPGFAPIAELSGVEAGYGKHLVLRGVDLAVYPGEVIALVGDNGAGKTTIARLVAGLLTPQKGHVLVKGRKPRPGHGEVGLVLQNPLAQLFCRSVEDEVAFGPANLERSEPAQVEDLLGCFDLHSVRHRPVFSLSCGQQQRTVVASVLALRPQLLVLDEPTMGQDWAHLSTMMDYLRRLAGEGLGVLLVTHDYKLVHHYADRVVLLRDGHVAANGRLRNGYVRKEPAACHPTAGVR